MQDWPTPLAPLPIGVNPTPVDPDTQKLPFLAGLNASNFVKRLARQGGTMSSLATDASGAADRAAILQYLLDARDGRVVAIATHDASSGEIGTAINFGRITPPTAPIVRWVKIQNERSNPVDFAYGFSSSSGFSVVDNSCGANQVPAADSCVLSIQFSPAGQAGQPRSANLQIDLSPTNGDPAFTGGPVGNVNRRVIALNGTENNAPRDVSAQATAGGITGTNISVLTGTTVTLSGAGTDAPDFDPLTFTWTVTAPGGTPQVLSSPSFVASAVGPYSAVLTVSDGLASTVAASVTVTASAPVPRFDPSVTTLSGFAARANSGNDLRPLTLCNGTLVDTSCKLTGSTADLILTAFDFTGPFSRDASSTCSAGGPALASGASCVLMVKFTPMLAGDTSGANVVVRYTGGSAKIGLAGRGTQSMMTTGVAPASAPDVQRGLSSVLIVSVANSGDAVLNFNVDANPQAPARLTGNTAFSIVDTGHAGACTATTSLAAPAPPTPGGSCTIHVRFLPTVLGIGQTAQLSLPSNAGNSPATLTLTGNGVALPPMQATPLLLSFVDTAFGDTSTAQTITLTNDRASTVSYTLDRHGSTDFVIVNDGSTGCPGRVVPARSGATSGQCTLQLAFNPQPAGGATARSLGLTVNFTAPAGEPTPTAIDINLSGNAKLALRPSLTDLSLNAVASTTTATATVALTNQSAAAITLGSLTLGGSGASVFSIDPSSTCSAALARAPGASCLVVLRYSPTLEGTQDATLTVTHSAPGSPINVSLHGTATPAPQGRLEVGAATLAFGDTQLAASSTQTLLLHNAGNKVLAFSAFDLGGSAAADYTVSTLAAGSCSLSVPLAINGDCVLTLSLRPGALGQRSATLTVRSDGSNPAQAVGLSGNGIPVPVPVLSFVGAAPTDTALNFGPQTLGGLYPSRLVRVVNTGTAALRISAVGVSGTGFALADASACAVDLAPQASCSIAVAFAPTAAGQSFAGTLQLTSNAAGSPQGFDLRGSGVAYVVPVLAWVAPAGDLQFGNVSAGSVSATQSITLLNQGPGGATLQRLGTVGLDAAVFLVGTDDASDNTACRAGKLMLEGDSCRVDVRFAPGASGLHSAGLQVLSSGSAPAARQVQGTGLASARALLQLSGTALDFGATRVGAQSLPLTLVLGSPEGAGAVRVAALAISGPFQIIGGNCPALPFVLAAGSNCTLSLGHMPNAEGANTGSLQVDSDAGPAQVVALQGRGEAAAAVSGGGCTLVDGRGEAGFTARDPTLWVLVLLAAAALGWRRLRRPAPTASKAPAGHRP